MQLSSVQLPLVSLHFVRLVADRVARYRGLPITTVADRDPPFVSEFRWLFCRDFGIDRTLSRAWQPQPDGQTERANRIIEQILRTCIQIREEEWPDILPALELDNNCTTYFATGLSPFEVMLGENPLRRQDVDLVDVFPPTLTPPTTKPFRLLVDLASSHLEQAKQDQKAFADASRRPLDFFVGDLVWVPTRNIAARGCPKLQQRYIGSYRILERIGPAAYKLQLPPSMPIHTVFDVSLLSSHRRRPQDMASPPQREPIGKASDGVPLTETVRHNCLGGTTSLACLHASADVLSEALHRDFVARLGDDKWLAVGKAYHMSR
ncbi:hypothetical protein Esti_002406 [Eimeria stiedai]